MPVMIYWRRMERDGCDGAATLNETGTNPEPVCPAYMRRPLELPLYEWGAWISAASDASCSRSACNHVSEFRINGRPVLGGPARTQTPARHTGPSDLARQNDRPASPDGYEWPCR